MKKSLILLAGLMAVSTIGYAASIQSLNKAQITKLISDRTLTTISTVTINGDLQNNMFTGFWGKDGKVEGQFANKPDNDPQKDTGSWMVKKDGSLCLTWDHWNSGKQFCVYGYQTKNTVIFVNSNGKFESAVLLDDIKSGNQIS